MPSPEDDAPKAEVVASPDANFSFPFTPYGIQLDLMQRIYATLDDGGVGVFESPTGTGKTLSLLCATLTWLERALHAELHPPALGPKATAAASAPADDDEPDWLRHHGVSAAARALQERAVARGARRERVRKAALAAGSSAAVVFGGAARSGGASGARQRHGGGDAAGACRDPNAEFLLDDDWDSDTGVGASGGRRRRRGGAATFDGDPDNDSDSDTAAGGRVTAAVEEEDEYEPLQVVFCSRTHSQLAQVVGELRRTRFGSTLRAVVLAGRGVLCINDAVKALAPPVARLNDACRDLQKQQAKASRPAPAAGGGGDAAATQQRRMMVSSRGCPFLARRATAVAALREAMLEKPLDVEDMIASGKAASACPYYAARGALRAAHVVFLPYAALVNADMRDALGLRLEGAIVVVDEAHNLPEAVADAHAATVSGPALDGATSALDGYLTTYRARLAPGNARQLATLLAVARGLGKFLRAAPPPPPAPGAQDGGSSERVLRLNEFLLAAGLDHINLFKLARYCKESKVLLKVGGFGDSRMAAAAAAAGADAASAAPEAPPDASAQYPTSATTALQALLAFVVALTAPEQDGRVVVSHASSSADSRPQAPSSAGRSSHSSTSSHHHCGRLKFVLLSTASAFAPVAATARAVVLAGGTLGPPHVLASSLFPRLAPGRLRAHACGHIVPKDHLLALAVGTGPSGAALDFTFAGRGTPGAMDELGRLLLNVARCAPHGCVAFFPSFEYVDACCTRWHATGAWDTLHAAKPVFREPRTSGTVDALLERYGAAAVTHPGALLLCVVGGKLSEGINFSDRLGRCVVMIGLPYAPPTDAELAERMRWLDAEGPDAGGGPGAGRAYYEALCMRAVNQSIGRAIRHARDYAAVVLADARWTKTGGHDGGVASKLPAWMAQSLVTVNGPFGEAYSRMHRFFRERAAAEAGEGAP